MLYRFCRFILICLFKLLFHLKVTGHENIPRSGPVIIAANHASFLDPPLIGVALKRDVYFLARESLFKIWGFGWLIRKTHAFPIKRGVFDTAGLRTVFNLLSSEKVLLLFPEGTRSWDGSLQEPHAGVGMIAYKMKVPVVPVLITGSYSAWSRSSKMIKIVPVSVRFGRPIPLGDYFIKEKNKQTYKLISEKIMEEIEKLKK